MLENPPFGDGASIIVIVSRAENIEYVFATDLDAPHAFELSDPSAELTVLEMKCPLAAIGLIAGPQVLGALSDRPKFPEPIAVYTAPVVEGRVVAWKEEVAVPAIARDVLLRIAVPSDHLCSISTPRLKVTDISHRTPGSAANPTFGLSLDDGTALVATEDGNFFSVSAAGTTPVIGLSTTTPHHGALRSEDGEIWLVGDDGRVARGDLQRGFADVGGRFNLGGSPTIVRVDGPRTGAIDTFFAITDTTSFLRYHAGRWERLAGGNENGVFFPAVAWISADEAIAVASGSAFLLRYRSGSLQTEALSRAATEAATLSRYGTLVGASGRLYFPDSDGRYQGRFATLSGTVRAIHELGAHLLVCTTSSGCYVYRDDLGACSATGFLPGAVRYVVRLDDQRALILFASFGQEALVMNVLEIEEEVPDCLR